MLGTGSAARAGDALPSGSPSSISTQGAGTVTVAAHSVDLTAAVLVSAATATAAGEAAAARMASVLDALAAHGIDRSEIQSRGYTVESDIDWETGEVRSHRARNTVSVALDDPESVGEVIDILLGAGATQISQVEFLPEDRRAAEDEALRAAYAQARRDAEVLAAAAGGRLGRLVELSAQSGGVHHYGMMMEAKVASGPATEIPVPGVSISANVTASWEFVAE